MPPCTPGRRRGRAPWVALLAAACVAAAASGGGDGSDAAAAAADGYVWEAVHLGSLPAEDVAGRLPDVRYGAPAVAVDGGMVVTHGYRYNHHRGRAEWHNDTWRFDFKTLAWSAYSRGPASAVPSARYKHALVNAGAEHGVIALGGDDGGHLRSTSHVWGAFFADVYRLDTRDGTWANLTSSASAPAPGRSSVFTPRAGHAAVAYHGHLVVFGGDVLAVSAGGEPTGDGVGRLVDTAELLVYSFATGEWTALAEGGGDPWPTGRRAHTAVALWGMMYVFGGFSHAEGRRNLDDFWVLDLDAAVHGGRAVWRELPRGPPARGGHVAVADELLGKVWIQGGARCEPSCTCKADIWEWSAAQPPAHVRGAWREVDIQRGMRPVGRHFHAAVLDPASHYMYMFGGESYAPYAYFNDVWRIRLRPAVPNERYVDAALVYDGLGKVTTLMDPHVSRTVRDLLALRPPVYREHDRLVHRHDFIHARLLEAPFGGVTVVAVPVLCAAAAIVALWRARLWLAAALRRKQRAE